MRRSKISSKPTSGQGWSLTTADADCSSGHPTPGASAPSRGRPVARLRMEQRRGKPVTVVVVEGWSDAELRPLGKALKTLCGTGGTVKDAAVELQGDHRAALRAALKERGMQVKG